MRPNRGVAFVVTLFIVLVLTMLAGVMVQRLRHSNLFELEGRDQAAAFWAAQAGISYALGQWTADKSWQQDTYRVLEPSGASFTFAFGAGESVNNLESDVPAGTVPARQAYLKVVGESRGRQQTLEVLVGRSGLPVSRKEALLATGNITLAGAVDIKAHRSVEDNTEVEADLVSLKQAADADTISAPSGSVDVQGAVRCTSSLNSSINRTNIAARSFEVGATVDRPPDPNILGRVSAHSGAATPTLAAGQTRLPSGDTYFPNGINYEGDLELDGTNLYVNGPLNVTGSLSGTGSVFVTGDASLVGTTDIKAADAAGLALFVKGDVSLTGLDASSYIEEACAQGVDPGTQLPYSRFYQNTLDALRLMDQLMTAPDSLQDGSHWWDPAPGKTTSRKFSNAGAFNDHLTSDFDGLGDLLTHDQFSFLSTYEMVGIRENDYLQSNEVNLVGKVRAAVEAEHNPANATVKAFALKSLEQLGADDEGGFFGWSDSPERSIAEMEQMLATGDVTRFANSLNDMWDDPLLVNHPVLGPMRERLRQRLLHTLDTIRTGKLGAARFQGRIYCEGDLTCSNDLHVIGSIAAVGRESNVILNNCRITFVPEVAAQAGTSLGAVSVRAWFHR